MTVCVSQSLTVICRMLGMLSSFRMAWLPGWLISTFCRSSIAAGNGHCQQCENQHSLHECVMFTCLNLELEFSVWNSQCRCVLYTCTYILCGSRCVFPLQERNIIMLYKIPCTCTCIVTVWLYVVHLTFRQLQSVMVLINANLWIVMY